MTRTRALPLLLSATVFLAAAACETQKKPIRGFDKQPPGSIVLDNQAPGATGSVMVWPMFDLPLEPFQLFRLRLSGQDAVTITSQEDGFYDYAYLYLQGWTAARNSWFTGVRPDTYVVEIVDGSGQSWGQSAPLTVYAGINPYTPGVQLPGAIFANFDGKVASWNIDPLLQDADTATDEITVTNLVDRDLVVERCQISSGRSSACTPVGTVAPGADLLTVERMADLPPKDDHQALVIHLASDANQSYQRDLLDRGGVGFNFGSTCQVERIVVHGTRQVDNYGSTITRFAMSSCYGYVSGPIQ